jgi:hypothetical protein
MLSRTSRLSGIHSFLQVHAAMRKASCRPAGRGWLLLAALAGAVSTSRAQQVPGPWLAQSAETRSTVLQRLITDRTGSMYVAGRFTGQIRFGGTRLVSKGRTDAFIAKLTTSGHWAWAVAVGGSGSDSAHDIALDGQGNLLVAGSFSEQVTVGSRELISQGGQDVFVAAFTSEGEWRGMVTAGGVAQDEAVALAVGPQNTVVIAGRFQGEAVFGSHRLRAAAGNDGFIAHLDQNGNWSWAAQVGATEQGCVQRVAVDQQGSILATGYVGGTGQFGAHSLVSNGTHNAFVAKLSGEGTWQWAAGIAGASTTYGHALALDGQNRVYVTGSFSGEATFGPYQLSSVGGDDLYVARLSTAGQWEWVTSLPGPALETGRDLVLSSGGGVYVVGSCSRAAAWLNSTLPNQGGPDIFMGNLTTEGEWLGAQTVGAQGPDEATAVALSPAGELLVGGTFSFSEPGSGIGPQLVVGRFRLPDAYPPTVQHAPRP